MIWIYFIIIVFCLGASLLNKVSRQNFLWVYFLLVVVYELGLFYGLLKRQVYNGSPLLYITFFSYYYGYQKNGYREAVGLLGLSSVMYCLYLLFTNGIFKYSNNVGIALSIVYILFVLLWFLSQLTNVDEISLTRKQTFWISVSLLLWSVFFLFRVIPMYWLDINDTEFLIQINTAYQVLTILCYGLFFRALFCKH